MTPISNGQLREVPREVVHGSIEGVDFGPELYLIARSPRAVLAWERGHSWSVNGDQRYAESGLLLLPQRRPRGNLVYRNIGRRGGRLSFQRILDVRAEIEPSFSEGENLVGRIALAACYKRTLLIDGGGPPLMPHRRDGPEAYSAWRATADRGFYVKEQL